MEISRKNLRKEVLERIKYVKTCVMARELCLLVRTNRAVLEPNDVAGVCQYISTLCKEEGCNEPSELCQTAKQALSLAEEEKYLELCAQSCVKTSGGPRVPTYSTLYLIASLTISIGVVNLFPFPALYGGRIIFVLPELITRRRVPQKFENAIHAMGLILLLLFMVYINAMDFINPILLPTP